jgi:sodium pump decarboxylase gamma subunit
MSALIQQGLAITGIGMGVVFVLLTLMVGIIQGMSRFSRLFDSGEPVATSPSQAIDDGELLSVIAAAITAYRNQNRRGRHGTH